METSTAKGDINDNTEGTPTNKGKQRSREIVLIHNETNETNETTQTSAETLSDSGDTLVVHNTNKSSKQRLKNVETKLKKVEKWMKAATVIMRTNSNDQDTIMEKLDNITNRISFIQHHAFLNTGDTAYNADNTIKNTNEKTHKAIEFIPNTKAKKPQYAPRNELQNEIENKMINTDLPQRTKRPKKRRNRSTQNSLMNPHINSNQNEANNNNEKEQEIVYYGNDSDENDRIIADIDPRLIQNINKVKIIKEILSQRFRTFMIPYNRYVNYSNAISTLKQYAPNKRIVFKLNESYLRLIRSKDSNYYI